MKAAGSRPFRVLLAATLFSVSGDGITQIGVPWLVLLTTGSAGKAGVVALCTMLPAAFSALLGGTLADRVGARPVSIISDLACCISVGAIPALQLSGTLKFWELCILMAVTGLVHAPGNAARAVLLPAVARQSHVPVVRATGFYAGASRAASIIGSAAGGILITTLGAGHALFIDAGTFAASALLIGTRIRPSDLARQGEAGRPGPPCSRRRYRHDVAAGIRLVAATPLLLGITALMLVAQGPDQGWSTVILLVYSALAERLPRWPVFTLGFILVGMPRFAVAAQDCWPRPLPP